VLTTTVDIDPGKAVTLTLVVREPDGAGPVSVLRQPLLAPAEVRLH